MERPESFFKTCDISIFGDHLTFALTEPSGKKELLSGPFRVQDDIIRDEIKFPAGWSEAQKDEWARQRNLRAQAEQELSIHLKSGETLRTRGDRPGDGFCSVQTPTSFDRPGTYRLQVFFDDIPQPLAEESMKALEKRGLSLDRQQKEYAEYVKNDLGRHASNSVAFEVAP